MNNIQTVKNPNAPTLSSMVDVELKQPKESVKENIPDIRSKKWILYTLIGLMLGYMFFNMFITYDLYSNISSIESDISIIKTEQMNRTGRVYNKTRDRLYRQEFKDWLSMFERKNPELFIPIFPVVSNNNG